MWETATSPSLQVTPNSTGKVFLFVTVLVPLEKIISPVFVLVGWHFLPSLFVWELVV